MADCRVTCINLSGGSLHEHITHIGNSTVPWKLTVPDAINRINNAIDSFYVIDPTTGKRADVKVVNPANGRPYLRTYADGVWRDNLLSLPTCK